VGWISDVLVPDPGRQGIATRLINACLERWPFLGTNVVTKGGEALVESLWAKASEPAP
jgi:hypothetical protein